MPGRQHHPVSALDRLHRGFSLLELILVLTVIVLAGAVVGPRLLPRVGESGLMSAALQIKADLAEMRATAVESGVPMGCLVWHQRSEYVLGPASELLMAASVPGNAAGPIDTATASNSTTVPSRAAPTDTTPALPLTSAPSQPSSQSSSRPSRRAVPVVPPMRTVLLAPGLVLVPVVRAPSIAGTDLATDQQLPGESSATSSAGPNAVRTAGSTSASSSLSLQRGNQQSGVQRAVEPTVQPWLPEAGGAVAAEWSLIVFQPSGRSRNLQLALYDSGAGKWLGLRLRGLTGALTLSSIERLDPQTSGQRANAASSSNQAPMSATSGRDLTESQRVW